MEPTESEDRWRRRCLAEVDNSLDDAGMDGDSDDAGFDESYDWGLSDAEQVEQQNMDVSGFSFVGIDDSIDEEAIAVSFTPPAASSSSGMASGGGNLN